MSTVAMAATTIAATAAAPALAVEVSGNVMLTTDYRFRGVSQTTRDPAIQGGFDVAHESGLYVGTWASNVQFGTDASMELDLYVGYGGAISETVSWDVNYVRYEYPSDGSLLDYNEYGASLGFSELLGGSATVGVIASEDYLNLGDTTWFYPYLDYSYAVNDTVTIDAHVGLSLADERAFENTFGDDNYLDWSIGVTARWVGLDWNVAYVDTDIDHDFIDEAADATVVFSISKSL